jgi:hypothetical protein
MTLVRHEIVTPSVGVVLADPRGNWTALWRRELRGRRIRVHSEETLDAVTQRLATRQWDLVAIVLDLFAAEDLWNWWQLDRERRAAGRTCLLGGRGCEELGWALLEAGGAVWIREPQDIRQAVGVAERHCATISFERLSVTGRIECALPWR